MKRSFLFTLLLSSVLLSACSPWSPTRTTGSVDYTGPYPESESAYGMDGGKMMLDTSDNISAVPGEDRKIIKTGSLSLHMESVQDALPDITAYVEGLGGNVNSSNLMRGENSYSASMTVRVPSDQFDAAMSALKEKAVYVESEYTNASDVTEYYTDLETRLSNKQAEEKQYLEILTSATSVTDVLSVTQYLSSVRYEIESLQAQIKSYDTQIDASTIDLYLTEDESVSAVSETWKPASTVRTALSDFVVFLQGAVDAAIYLVIFGWPLLLLYVGVRAYMKRHRKSSKK